MIGLLTRRVAAADVVSMARAGALQLDGLGKRYGAVMALRDVSLRVGEGEVVSVTGPSGAGKSTLGRLVSGLEPLSEGCIRLAGQDVGALPPQARRVAHMFESYALYPTRTVLENIASPLNAPTTINAWTAQQKRERIDEVLTLTEMTRFHDRLPSQLSGGQKQRVALCRALAQDPSLFVLDEPIGHLDAKLRHKLRGEIRRRQRQLRQGTLWLTPDGIEAMAVADRMVVLLAGQVQQIGTPAEVFARPANVHVARLLGDPAMNVLPVSLHGGSQPMWALGDAAPVPVSRGLFDRLAPLARESRLMLGLRPADLRLLPASSTAFGERLAAQVYAVEPLGKHTLVTVLIGGQRLRVKAPADTLLSVGAEVGLAIQPEQLLSFDAVSGALHRPEQVPVLASLPQEVSP